MISDARDRRVPVETLITDLGGACFKDDGDRANWNCSSLDALMQHIIGRHHGFLRKELPSI